MNPTLSIHTGSTAPIQQPAVQNAEATGRSGQAKAPNFASVGPLQGKDSLDLNASGLRFSGGDSKVPLTTRLKGSAYGAWAHIKAGFVRNLVAATAFTLATVLLHMGTLTPVAFVGLLLFDGIMGAYHGFRNPYTYANM